MNFLTLILGIVLIILIILGAALRAVARVDWDPQEQHREKEKFSDTLSKKGEEYPHRVRDRYKR